MANTRAKAWTWSKAWPMVTLAFGAILFAALTVDTTEVLAQPKAKAKTPFEDKKGYERKSKNLPVAKSLTNGQKIEAAALTKIINQEIAKRLAAESVKPASQCSDEEFVRRVHLDIVG